MKKQNKNTSLNDGWVDVHDEALMIELGIHPPMAQPRDPSVWTKTNKEKKELARVKRLFKGKMHCGIVPVKRSTCKAKLIVQLKKNKKFPYTTYSIICYQHEIPGILSKYSELNKQTGCMKSLVSKYNYNGRNYQSNELP